MVLIKKGKNGLAIAPERHSFSPGQRQCHVDINGTRVLTNFDIIATVGAPHKALVARFAATACGSGQIVVVFTATTLDSACINGIEILSEFTGQDIGAVGVPGSVTCTNSTDTISGSGAIPEQNCQTLLADA